MVAEARFKYERKRHLEAVKKLEELEGRLKEQEGSAEKLQGKALSDQQVDTFYGKLITDTPNKKRSLEVPVDSPSKRIKLAINPEHEADDDRLQETANSNQLTFSLS